MAQQLLLLLPAPSGTFSKPLPSPFLSSLPRRHLVPVSAVRVAPAVRRGLLRYATKRSGLVEELEIAKDKQPRSKRANGIFWILLLNFGIYVADHVFQIQQIKSLYLYHAFPAWFQFVTSTFCHANWNHLSSNLFFVYIFGKLVEEEEGNFALWMSYILTGAGANLISWLVLPTSSVSLGASGAVFGLFTISVLVKMSWDWRKILEVLILGQFVVDKVMEAARATTITGQSFQVNNIAHVSDRQHSARVRRNIKEDMMPQLRSLLALLLVATAVAAVVAVAAAGGGFVVTGRVYCDSCRAGFETNISHAIQGATVEMECRHFKSQQVHDKAQGTTDAGGWYKMEISGDHQDEICDVRLLKSPEADCAEIEQNRYSCRVPLTKNDGIKQSGIRYANPIAFFRKAPLPNCGEILRAYDLYNETSENS